MATDKLAQLIKKREEVILGAGKTKLISIIQRANTLPAKELIRFWMMAAL